MMGCCVGFVAGLLEPEPQHAFIPAAQHNRLTIAWPLGMLYSKGQEDIKHLVSLPVSALTPCPAALHIVSRLSLPTLHIVSALLPSWPLHTGGTRHRIHLIALYLVEGPLPSCVPTCSDHTITL